MEHGYYFEELGFIGQPKLGSDVVKVFQGGSFPFDLTRRKVISYHRPFWSSEKHLVLCILTAEGARAEDIVAAVELEPASRGQRLASGCTDRWTASCAHEWEHRGIVELGRCSMMYCCVVTRPCQSSASRTRCEARSISIFI